MGARLANKVALITGAAMGQGKAAAEIFAQEGARVVVSDMNDPLGEQTVESIRSAGGEAIYVHCDVSSSEQVKAAVEEAVRHYGGIHILYNNAGIAHKNWNISVTDISEEEWDKIQGVNLKGVFYTCKYAIPHMVEAGGGAIVNTSSVAALIRSPGGDSYIATKGAIISLTRSIAVSQAKHGIRANVICPGYVITPMTEEMEKTTPGMAAAAAQATPLGRGAVPEEIARVALFLASDDASFVTGAILTVDGGLTCV